MLDRLLVAGAVVRHVGSRPVMHIASSRRHGSLSRSWERAGVRALQAFVKLAPMPE